MQNKKNPLLARSEVGKPKEPSRKLPPLSHTYGVLSTSDQESAMSLISSWNTHIPTVSSVKYLKDYSKLNKLGVAFKVTDPKQVKYFREKVDCKVRLKRKKLDRTYNLPNDSHVYGDMNRASTPIKKILEHGYAADALKKTHIVYTEGAEKSGNDSKSFSIAQSTSCAVLPSAPNMFKLSRFSKIKSTLKLNNKRINP